jgi:hypothetical protein
MTGSITDIPPEGPSVPSGTSIEYIQGLISNSEAAYNTALPAYNSAQATYADAKNTADSKYSTYLQSPSQTTLDDYTNAVAALQTTANAWQTALANLHWAAINYVNDLAYQQIYYAQTSGSTISTALSSILSQSLPSSASLSQSIPPFPWLSSAQITALTSDNTQLGPVLANVLSDFQNYRHIEWLVSYDTACIQNIEANVTVAAHNLNLANAGVVGYDVSECQTAYNDAVAEKEYYQADLSMQQSAALGIISSLNSSITAYETTYNNIKNLGTPLPTVDTTLQTIINFCANWNTNVVLPAQTALSADLNAAITALVAANQEMIANFNAQFSADHPALSATTIAQLLSQLAAVQSALTSAGVTLVSSINTPQLPASSSSMSMTELMKIIGQAELMSEEMIKQAADAEHQITSLRLQFAISHLMLYANELAALEVWSEQLKQAQIAFNASVEAENQTTFNNNLATYNLYKANIPLINQVIDQVNAQISAENARAQALVDASNEINPAVLLAIFSEQISIGEAPDYLISHLIGITPTSPALPSTVTFTPIPLFAHISESDLPNPPYTSYPEVGGLDLNVMSTFNQQISAFLTKIAPFSDLVQQALTAASPAGTNVDLSIILLKSLMFVQDIITTSVQFKSAFTLLYSFLSQTTLSGMSSKSQEEKSEDLLSQLYEILGYFGGSTGQGASIGIGGSLLASAGAFGAALSQIANSSIFNQTIEAIVQRAAMFAGLQVAGTLPQILSQLTEKNMTLTDLLELEGQKGGAELEAQTRSDLINAFMQQLALVATTPGALSQSAVDLIKNFPSLTSLSQDQLAQLISGVVTVEQMVLLALTVLLGSSQGLAPAQMVTSIFGGVASTTADMLERFEGLGIPEARATELAALSAGYDELEKTLSDLGFDPQTRTMLMALIASAQGRIPLTDGAPGGPAFLDTLLTELKSHGVTVTANISSPDFLSELIKQLEIKANEDQRAILRSALLGEVTPSAPVPIPSPSPLTLTQQFQQAAQATWDQINEIYTTPTPTVPVVPATAPINPTSILSHFISLFQTLAPDIQSELVAEAAANPNLAAIPELSDEQKASLMIALRLGVITAPEGTSLLNLAVLQSQMAAQGAQITLSTVETSIITKLFTPTPDELRQREEHRLRDINAPYIAPTTVSPQVLDQVSVAFRKFFNDISDQTSAAQAFEVFSQSIQRLSDFNKVAVDTLLDPAKIIMRQFSIITRTAQDRIQQPKISLDV